MVLMWLLLSKNDDFDASKVLYGAACLFFKNFQILVTSRL